MSEIDGHEEDYYGNALEIAGDNYKQSEVVQAHKHLPIDTKTAFLDKYEKIGYGYKSNAYDTLRYLKKLLNVSNIEINNTQALKKDIYNCKNTEDLGKYFKKLNKNYMWNPIKSMDKKEKEEEVSLFIKQLDRARLDGIVNDMYEGHINFITSMKDYLENNPQESYRDDIGLLNTMMTYAELSKAFKGNFSKHIRSTINITKDVRPDDEAEEEPEDTESSGGFFKMKKKQ